MMKVGKLFYDHYEERYAIKYDDSSFSELFHCGDCLQVYFNNKWIDTRFEMNCNGWYLIGIDSNIEKTSLLAKLYS